MSQKAKASLMSAAVVFFGAMLLIPSFANKATAEKSAAELEKEKALQNPYPNDLGPNEIDEIAKTYPKDVQDGYKLLKVRCAQCHQPARPLNSRFVEPEAAKEKKEAAVSELKKEHPDYFAESGVWQIESNVWERYVKRMMSKPGCKIEKEEGKKIWKFLVYDGSHRKIGANAEKWKEHRKKLISEFKTKYPKRYEELEKEKDL